MVSICMKINKLLIWYTYVTFLKKRFKFKYSKVFFVFDVLKNKRCFGKYCRQPGLLCHADARPILNETVGTHYSEMDITVTVEIIKKSKNNQIGLRDQYKSQDNYLQFCN